MEVNREVILRLLTGLRECSRHVERGVSEHPLDELDVGLLALAEAADGTLRPSQAAEALEAPFPSVTRHVRGLQGAGQVSVAPDPGDGRSYQIALTPAGKALLDEFRDELVTRFAPVLTGWAPDEVATLADGLTRLAASMTATRRAIGPRPARPAWWRAGAPPGEDAPLRGERK